MIDLCKIFGVEEGEEFEFNKYKGSRYKVSNGRLEFLTDKCWVNSAFEFNEAIGCEVIKLPKKKVPKKKEFTDDELDIFRKIPKEYKWCARDKSKNLYTYRNKPFKAMDDLCWTSDEYEYGSMSVFKTLFQNVHWEDEEPVFIDDYVERGAENE